ncbi:TRAP transporter substrate-binding protein DctP, partial [Cetobacterium sp.]|uniref:TRAP transporter substrate-binding protein DctP n=1 Tax=Cetobacterium sp. TaxID=2071632 RepID=UPI003EE78BCE
NIAWSEVYNGIQTKSIDGCEVQYTSAVSSHIYEVAKFVNKTEHINLLNCIVASDKWFKQLPEDYKNILIETAQETGYENAKYVISLQDKLEQDLVNNGMTIVEVDKEAFKLAANKAYDVLKFTELREKIYNEIGKNN